MSKLVINFLLSIELALDVVFFFLIFIAPILFVTFLRSKSLAVSLGAISFMSGVVLDTIMNCLHPQAVCNDETYEAGPLIFGCILGLIYSLLALVVTRLVALLRRH